MKNVLLSAVVCVGIQGCISVPKIEGEDEAKLEKLATAGKDFKEVKSPILAGVLNIVPGVGQMYAGDWGDGVVTLLFFWTVYHYYIGFVDAVQESRVKNAKYTIQFYQNEGFKFSLNQHNSSEIIDVSKYDLDIKNVYKF